MQILETFQSRPLLNDLRTTLNKTLGEWVDGYHDAMIKARESLRRSQTNNLKKHFGSFDEKNTKKIEKMYSDYTKKQDDALYEWAVQRLTKVLSFSLHEVLKKYDNDCSLNINFLNRSTTGFVARASMSVGGRSSGHTLSLYMKWDEWKSVLTGDASLKEIVNDLTADVVHEMVHYNQMTHNAKNGNDIFDRNIAIDSRNFQKKFKKELNKAKEKGGTIELSDLGYYASNVEIEAYAASIAVEVIDDAKKLNISPIDYLKSHAGFNRSLRNYAVVAKRHPEVWRKLIKKVVLQINHLTEKNI